MKKFPGTASKYSTQENVLPFKRTRTDKSQGTKEVEFRSPFLPVRTDDIEPPLDLATEHDANVLRIHLQTQIFPSVEEIEMKWRRQIAAAKTAWGKLTEAELVKIGGHKRKLVALIEDRYAVKRDDAERQVSDFFEKH